MSKINFQFQLDSKYIPSLEKVYDFFVKEGKITSKKKGFCKYAIAQWCAEYVAQSREFIIYWYHKLRNEAKEVKKLALDLDPNAIKEVKNDEFRELEQLKGLEVEFERSGGISVTPHDGTCTPDAGVPDNRETEESVGSPPPAGTCGTGSEENA
jgi:hypothetical protein